MMDMGDILKQWDKMQSDNVRKQKEADIKLIEKACGGEFADYINPKTYTDMLAYEPASVVFSNSTLVNVSCIVPPQGKCS